MEIKRVIEEVYPIGASAGCFGYKANNMEYNNIRIYIMKQDFARSVSNEAISPKQPECQIINLHGLYEKPVEIASLRSQNPYTYYA